VQEEQNGTGHAVLVALEALGDVEGDSVIVVPGDTPLITSATLSRLIDAHHAAEPSITLLTTHLPDPTGYGRIVRDDAGEVVGIVEERDADDEQRRIDEVGVSMYAFAGGELVRALNQVGTANDQGEMYLTDVIGILAGEGAPIAAVAAPAPEVSGVNSHDQLAAVGRLLRARLNERWMRDGVSMLDPDRVYLDSTVELAAGVVLMPDVHLQGSTSVAAGAQVGPSVFAEDSSIGPGARVWYSVLRGADVGESAEVGPFASLRPGTVLGPETKAGTFVETKNTTLQRGSKVPHLSYMGDAEIGEDSNIGAGTITCNYDGFEKHRTTIGDRVRIGSDTMLVAPVEIGDDAWTGAGSTITKDVSPGALGVERSHQQEIPDYAARRNAKRPSSE
ncbi:MAG: bifunctional UDP-N-acetylglucosamine diphosphorylase/glucosamine-1-phosphate N-acetyltransferase GlmU, partial [Acidimicrobiia bacterium]|nr:bifunctional UDP-N-acetylglucosamine diphosphorylase/glucosamine-1-phosphate N-acetyltransferase GlmU [Acidimicrobiia bacterium]